MNDTSPQEQNDPNLSAVNDADIEKDREIAAHAEQDEASRLALVDSTQAIVEQKRLDEAAAVQANFTVERDAAEKAMREAHEAEQAAREREETVHLELVDALNAKTIAERTLHHDATMAEIVQANIRGGMSHDEITQRLADIKGVIYSPRDQAFVPRSEFEG